jgi:hypothetical protein
MRQATMTLMGLLVLALTGCAPGPERIVGSIDVDASPSSQGDDGGWESNDDRRAPHCWDDDDCSALGLYCDKGQEACVSCTEDAQCGRSRPYCRPERRICVMCLTDSHCFSGDCDEDKGYCRDSNGHDGD